MDNQKQINIKGPIWKTGKGFVLTIPKSFIDSGLFKEGEEIQVTVPLWKTPLEQPEPKPLKKTSLEALREKPMLLTLIRAVDSICFHPNTFNCITGTLRTREPLAV